MAKDENLSFDHAQVCLLLDFYGSLLTVRTREVLDLYFDCDLSLAEIAENLGISRQAVHDKVRQGSLQLRQLEGKLSLMRQHQETTRELDEALRLLQNEDQQAACKLLERLRARL